MLSRIRVNEIKAERKNGGGGGGSVYKILLEIASLDMPLEHPPREIPQLKCRRSNTESFIQSSTADKSAN